MFLNVNMQFDLDLFPNVRITFMHHPPTITTFVDYICHVLLLNLRVTNVTFFSFVISFKNFTFEKLKN